VAASQRQPEFGVDKLLAGRFEGKGHKICCLWWNAAAVLARSARRTKSEGKSMIVGRIVMTAAVLTFACTGATLAQDVEKGATVFKKCAICHNIGPGATNKVGPELNGLDGRHSGTAAGYNYSEANKKSGIVWDESTFKKYIADPRAMIPGTKMTFAGDTHENEVNDLWAYVKQFDAEGNIKK
jgi:cytochrome c